MYESYLTIVGNLTADPVLRHTKDGRPFATFRVASTARRWDGRAGGYVDGGTNFVSVAAFNALAANVVASCHKGQPVIVYGRLRINTWTPAEGRSTSSVEIDAYHVGHDLSWGQAGFTKVARAQFDRADRLAGDEVQESLAEVERAEAGPAPERHLVAAGGFGGPSGPAAVAVGQRGRAGSAVDFDDDLPEDLPEDLAEDLPEDMPEDMPAELPEELSGGLTGDLGGRLAEGDGGFGLGDPDTDPYVVARAG